MIIILHTDMQQSIDDKSKHESDNKEMHDCSLVLRRQGLMHIPMMVLDQLRNITKLDLSHNSIESIACGRYDGSSVSLSLFRC